MTRWYLKILSIITVLSLVVVPVATADTEYAITSTPSIETPERTFNVEGSEYTVSSVGRVMPGEELQIETTAPAETGYDVYLYDSDRRIIDAKSGNGDDSLSFPTENLEAGSYIAAIYGPDGNIEVVQPVVIAGYDVEVETSQSISEGAPLEVAVSLQRISETAELHSVEVVILEGNSLVERTTAEEIDGEYTASLNSLSEGEYTVYAVARNETVVRDQQELIGISDTTDVEVTAESEGSSGSSTEDPSSSNGGSQSGSASQDPSSSTPSTETAVGTSTDTVTSQKTATESPTETEREATATQTTDANVVTPAQTTSIEPTTTTESDGPWLSALLIVLVLIAAIATVRQK